MITNNPNNSTVILRSHVATSRKTFDFLQNTAMALVIGAGACWSTTAQSQTLAMTSEQRKLSNSLWQFASLPVELIAVQ